MTIDDENLMCECEGEGGDEKAKTEKDEGEESLAKLNWVLQGGLLIIIVMIMIFIFVCLI